MTSRKTTRNALTAVAILGVILSVWLAPLTPRAPKQVLDADGSHQRQFTHCVELALEQPTDREHFAHNQCIESYALYFKSVGRNDIYTSLQTIKDKVSQ